MGRTVAVALTPDDKLAGSCASHCLHPHLQLLITLITTPRAALRARSAAR